MIKKEEKNRIIELSIDEKYNILNNFYNYFETGYKFENFLKYYLENLGLVEVSVTQKTRDGGIDLFAKRSGVIDENDKDAVEYKVQAKRIKPSSSVSPEKIDALRGNIIGGQKGLFITTGKVSSSAKENAMLKDPSKPIIVIDGLTLINSCIDLNIGFSYKPIFVSSYLDKLMNIHIDDKIKFIDTYITKTITYNDIRARIISIPKLILDKINKDIYKIKTVINDESKIELTVNKGRNYLAGVTSILKKYELIKDGIINPKEATWNYNEKEQVLYIEIRK